MWEVFLLVVGAIIGIFAKPLDNWIFAPKLKLVYSNDDRKYIIETKDAVTVRVAVRNKGRGTAKSVRIMANRLVLRTSEKGRTIFESDVLDLKFAKTGELAMDIPRDTYRFVNVCRIVPPNIRQELEFMFQHTPQYFPGGDLVEGVYHVTLYATGENCATRSRTVRFYWDGMSDIRFVGPIGRIALFVRRLIEDLKYRATRKSQPRSREDHERTPSAGDTPTDETPSKNGEPVERGDASGVPPTSATDTAANDKR